MDQETLCLVFSPRKLAKMVCSPLLDGADVRPAWRLTDNPECSSLPATMRT